MDNKKILLIVFVIVALVQIYIPVKMILDREDVIATGIEYKFKTAPVDPSDPFRGKYIILSFESNDIKLEADQDFVWGETVYVTFENDEQGFAKIKFVSKEKPKDNSNFIMSKVDFVAGEPDRLLTVNYPFDRYYMEETKAYDAELAYNESQSDTSQVTYALVSVKDGASVLTDVMINGRSISQIAAERQGN